MVRKILIIEDDPLITNIYANVYSKSGYDVISALDGETGLQKVLDFRPDLVQLDLMMPKINGVELIRRIRLQPAFKTIPIVVLSSCYHTETIQQAMQAGANQILSKQNCSPKVVLESVKELLNPSGPAVPAATVSEQAAPATPRSIQAEFLKRAPQMQAEVRNRFHLLVKGTSSAPQPADLEPLCAAAHLLTGYAGIAGFVKISHIAGALEEFLKQLQAKPKHITASAIRTIAKAVDCLNRLFAAGPQAETEFAQAALILAVDDEPISRQTLCAALSKVALKTISLDGPQLALQVMAQNTFDLIFLDVEMPEMDGFELCKKLRELPANEKTPVVFVTSHSGFDSHARSAMNGGNDLISKPFLLIELGLKALTFIVNTNLESPPTAP